MFHIITIVIKLSLTLNKVQRITLSSPLFPNTTNQALYQLLNSKPHQLSILWTIERIQGLNVVEGNKMYLDVSVLLKVYISLIINTSYK